MPIEYRESPFFQAIRSVDIVHTNQWRILIIDTEDGGSPNDIKYFLARSVSLPFWKPETESHKGSGDKYYTGMNKDLDFSIEFTETASFTCLRYFNRWQDLVFDKTKMLFNTGLFKRNIIVTFVKMTKANPDTVLAKFTLVNCAVKDIDDYSLSYDSGEPLITKVNFTCDKITVEYPNP